MMDDDDPIVEEVSQLNKNIEHQLKHIYFKIPVYLSKSLAKNLVVIQFPIKNKSYDIDKASVSNCCVKPLSQQVKIAIFLLSIRLLITSIAF
jgi:RPC5 protein